MVELGRRLKVPFDFFFSFLFLLFANVLVLLQKLVFFFVLALFLQTDFAFFVFGQNMSQQKLLFRLEVTLRNSSPR